MKSIHQLGKIGYNKLRENGAYVTLLSSNDYLAGVLLLNWSLKKVNTRFSLFVVCSDTVSEYSIDILKRHKINYIKLTEHIPVPTDSINLGEGYDHWNRTFDKLYIWSLTQFSKIVYLDSDMQVIRNIDHLFDAPHMSAVRADEFNEPGIDKLNSGLMVIHPNKKEFLELCEFWGSGAIHFGNIGDQDVIRAYYEDWGKYPELTLSPGYNVLFSEVSNGIIPRSAVEPVSVIHYIGTRKPWMVSPRAIWRRSKQNFLWTHLWKYYFAFLFLFSKHIR